MLKNNNSQSAKIKKVAMAALLFRGNKMRNIQSGLTVHKNHVHDIKEAL